MKPVTFLFSASRARTVQRDSIRAAYGCSLASSGELPYKIEPL